MVTYSQLAQIQRAILRPPFCFNLRHRSRMILPHLRILSPLQLLRRVIPPMGCGGISQMTETMKDPNQGE